MLRFAVCVILLLALGATTSDEPCNGDACNAADMQVMLQSKVGLIEGTKDELVAENANTDHVKDNNDERVLKQGLEEDDESEMDVDEEEDEDNESEDYALDQENAEEESGGTGGNEEQEVLFSNMNISGMASAGATSVQSVEAVHSGGFLSIRFRHEDQEYDYKVLPRSVYAADAEVYNGSDSLEVGPPTTYRAHGEHGKWAAMSLHSDGSVQGLFLHENRLLQVTPVQDIDGAELPQFDGPLAAMLQGFSGPGTPHLVQWLDKSPVLLALGIQQPVDIDEDGAPMPEAGAGAREEEEAEVQGVNAWGGNKWAGKGKCYKGDEEMHEMTLGIYVDKAARKKKGDQTVASIESMVNQASFIFEMQMHFALKIATLELDFFGNCKYSSSHDNLMWLVRELSYLSTSTKKLTFRALNHVISGCMHNGAGMRGGLCRRKWNSGVSAIGKWHVFVHEIGHQLHAQHAFGYGGIMDYGSGKVNGHYQFHRKSSVSKVSTNKKKICGLLNEKVDKCKGNFQKESGPSRRRTPLKVVGTAPTDAEIRELNEINSETGENWTLEAATTCVKSYHRVDGVDAKECAQLCKKQKGCREFSFGGFGDRGSTQCKYAEDGWGCCKYLDETPEWIESYCVPGGEGLKSLCSMGNCRHYTMNTITTVATLWRQYLTGKVTRKKGFRCKTLSDSDLSEQTRVPTREACQDFAIKNGHKYYRYFPKPKGTKKKTRVRRYCQSYRNCVTVKWGPRKQAQIFSEEDPTVVDKCSGRKCSLKKDPNSPTMPPTEPPTEPPTNPPTQAPRNSPSEPPTNYPTKPPTNSPTEPPTNSPTESPTKPPPPPAPSAQCSWGPETVGSIAGHNIRRAPGRKSIAECKALCEAEPSCKSIDIEKKRNGKGKCFLGDCRIGEGCDNDDDKNYLYFACNPAAQPPPPPTPPPTPPLAPRAAPPPPTPPPTPPPAPSARCSWGPETIGSIAGHNIRSAGTNSIAECKALCEAEPSCKSIDIKKRRNGKVKCVLGDCRIGEGCDNDDDKKYLYFACNPVA